jgi:CubicO group peptidase (beta-lactamase class C family)
MILSHFLWALGLLVAMVQAQINPWQARHGLTSDEYQATFNDLTGKGYRLNYVSGYALNNVPHFAAIFEKKSSPEWVARHGMTSQQYQSYFDSYVQQGFRLVLVNGYTVNGVDYYASIWDKSPSNAWVARHGLTSSDYQTAFNNYVSQGYRLKHVSGYTVGNDARYAAIWEKTNDGIEWVARHGMTSSDYQTAFDTYHSQGFRLVLVNGYQVGNTDYYVAIWDKSSSGPWVARHGLTSDEYQRNFDNNYYQGFVLKTISGYNQAGHYAALWENPVMKQSDLTTINNDIQAYMTKYSVPGLSLAITQNERLVFAQGFGLADKASNTIVSPKSKFRIMSISKSITATAVMQLHAAGHFNMSDRVFGPGSLTGDKYGDQVPLVNGKRQYSSGITAITVQDLLNHQAGWGANSDPEGDLITMTPAQAVSKIVANVPLTYTPPGSSYFYSNFGFLILGRLVADISGMEYEDYVKQKILSPAGATAVQLASDAGPISEEVTYYPLGASGNFRIHEFSSFGGWVATAIDMCRWSVHVDGIGGVADLLSTATEQDMWTAASHNGGYGKGWLVNQAPGSWRGHNGAFSGTGSFFTQRTDGSGIGFMVVMNQNSKGDEYSWELRGVVDSMISKVSGFPAFDLF